ncbi:MAG: ABC transporter permease [Nitriliruptoraceae bacterium]
MAASQQTTAPRATTFRRVRRALLRRGPLVMFGIVLVYIASQSSAFLSSTNLLSSLVQAAPIAIVSFGLAAVVMGGGDDVVAGGIDLSIPAGAALATAILSDQLTNAGAGLPRAFLLAAMAALVVGVVNAFLITVVGLTSILSTLATYATVVGVVRVLTENRRINVDHPTILFVRDERLLGIPMVVVLMLLAFAGFAFLLHRTPYGMRIQAVGGNRDAAETSGIRPRPYIASTFLLGGLAASVAAIALTARGSGMSPGIDERLMIDMVLATFLGATFSPRNVVTVPGALLGAVLVALLSNGLILLRIDNSWVDGMKGVLILVVVASAALQNRERS